MIAVLIEVFILGIAAIYAGTRANAQHARRAAITAMGLVNGIGLVLAISHSQGDSTISWITCMIGLAAVALSPVTKTQPRTFSRILLLIGLSLLFVTIQSPLWLAVLWSLVGCITWAELFENTEIHRASARIFAIYHIPSIGLFWVGAVLLQQGNLEAALIPLLISITIREAMIPVHSWFPHFVERVPMGIVVTFAGPQLGVYAHLQVFAQGLPIETTHYVAWFGAFTAVIAAAIGTVQTKARRALAFLFMSQTGLVAFGLENHSSVAHAGALLSWQVVGLATSGFFMTLAALEARRGFLSLHVPNGSFTRTPQMAVAFLFLGFASVGLPLTAGFVAEDLLVQGSVDEFPLLGLALIMATALNGLTVMRAFFVLFSGSSQHSGEQDLTRREIFALTLVMATLLLSGVFPNQALQWLTSETQQSTSIQPESFSN